MYKYIYPKVQYQQSEQMHGDIAYLSRNAHWLLARPIKKTRRSMVVDYCNNLFV